MKKKGTGLIFGFACGKVAYNLRIHLVQTVEQERDSGNHPNGEDAVLNKARKDDCGAVIFCYA